MNQQVVNEYNGIAMCFNFLWKDCEIRRKGNQQLQLVYFNHRWWIANVLGQVIIMVLKCQKNI